MQKKKKKKKKKYNLYALEDFLGVDLSLFKAQLVKFSRKSFISIYVTIFMQTVLLPPYNRDSTVSTYIIIL